MSYLDGYKDAEPIRQGYLDIIHMWERTCWKIAVVAFGAGIFLGGYLALAVERLIK